MIIDFREIESREGYDFERFVEDLLESLGWTILVKAGQGPDGGRDIIASVKEEHATGKVFERKYVIQCKHYAQSKKSVTPNHIIHFEVMPAKHATQGWLLVTSSKVSQDTISTIHAAEEAHKGIIFDSWDVRDIEKLVLSDRCRNIFKQYFPQSYSQHTNIIIPTLEEVRDLIAEWIVKYKNEASNFFVNPEMEQLTYSFAISNQMSLDDLKKLGHSDALISEFMRIWVGTLRHGKEPCGIVLLFKGLQRLRELQNKGFPQDSIEMILTGELSLSAHHRNMKRKYWRELLIYKGKSYEWATFQLDGNNVFPSDSSLCGLQLIIFCAELQENATGRIRIVGESQETRFVASAQLESNLELMKFPLGIPLSLEYKLDKGSDEVLFVCLGYAYEMMNYNGLRNVSWYRYV